MAPIWMKTVNIFQNGSSRLMLIHRSHRSRWPVELTGMNSVRPSTMPRMIALPSSSIRFGPSIHLLRPIEHDGFLDVLNAAEERDGHGGIDAKVAHPSRVQLQVPFAQPLVIVDVQQD